MPWQYRGLVWVLILMLSGCTQSAAFSTPAPLEAQRLPTTAQPLLKLSQPVPPEARHSFDNMPILGADMDAQPRRDAEGILRSPIDNMPIILGDQHGAPMPLLGCDASCPLTRTLPLSDTFGVR